MTHQNSKALLFKYTLNLLSDEDAVAFQTYSATCAEVEEQLKEIRYFLELLQKALKIESSPAVFFPQKDEVNTDNRDRLATLANLFNLPSDLSLDQLINVFANCFSGFQKLRKNIAVRMKSQADMSQIDLAAIEILLALPVQVSHM